MFNDKLPPKQSFQIFTKFYKFLRNTKHAEKKEFCMVTLECYFNYFNLYKP